jgi:antitoxin component YwqK of YwqJK toxin-antitoxin module
MKRFLTIIILLLIWNLSNAQHTDRFKKIVSELEKIESKPDTIFYRNGKIWWISTITTYKYNSETYSTYSGKQTQYYKNGKIASELLLGNYGNILSWKSFDREGNNTSESITTEIDSNAKNLTEFFKNDDHIIFKRIIKKYKCSSKLGVYYLFKEGKTINGKKNGIWKTYGENGKLKKKNIY